MNMNSRILVVLSLSLLLATVSAVELSHDISRDSRPVVSALHPAVAPQSTEPASPGSTVRPGQAAGISVARDQGPEDSATYSAAGQGSFNSNGDLADARR